jgi:protein ImuA
MMADARQATIQQLRAKLSAALYDADSLRFSGDIGPLAPLLGPAWRAGGTAELCGPEPATLTLAAWLAAQRKGPAVLIDPTGTVSPQALALLGLDLKRIATVQPTPALALWALEQALRCPAVATTLCRIGPRLATNAARRIKLAAEVGGGIGLAVRPAAREPPFADARLVVRPVRSEGRETLCPRWEIEAVYVRGGTEGLRCVVEVTTDARLVLAPASLVRAADSRRRVGG